MEKAALRKIYKEKRKVFSSWLINDWSLEIMRLGATKFDFDQKNVGLFLPISQHKEVNLFPFLHLFPNAHCFVPKSDFETNKMTFHLFDTATQLSLNAFQILEPIASTEIEIENLDFLFIPLLISDKNGYRLGYGRGFYDRIIPHLNKDCIKIGVSIFEPIEEIKGIDPYDQKLDYLITPSQIHHYV